MDEVVLSDKTKEIEDRINNLSKDNIDEFLKSDLLKEVTELIKGDEIEHSEQFELLGPILRVAGTNNPSNEYNRSPVVRKKLWDYLENKLKIKSDFLIDLDWTNNSEHILMFNKTKTEKGENIPTFYSRRKITDKTESLDGEINVENSEDKVKEDFRDIVKEVRNERFPGSDLIEKIPIELTSLEGNYGEWYPPKPGKGLHSSISINLDIIEEDVPENVKRIILKNTLTHEYSHAFIELKEAKYDLYRGLSPNEWKNHLEILADLLTILKGGVQDFRRMEKDKRDPGKENNFSYYTPDKFRRAYEEVVLKKEGIETARNLQKKYTKKIDLLSIIERDWSILTRNWDYDDPEVPITSDEDLWEMLKENYQQTYLWKYFGEITEPKREEYFENLREDEEISEKKSELKEELAKIKLRDNWEGCYDFALDYEKYNKYLEEGVLHKKMIDAFEDNGSELPEDAILSKEIIGWVVKVGDKEKHWIEDVNDELKVYTKIKKLEDAIISIDI